MSPKKLWVGGAFVLVLAGLDIFYGTRAIGFYLDDWGYVEVLGRLGTMDFAMRSFDPRQPNFLNTYRPMQGVLLAIESLIFGFNADAFHVIHIVIHSANAFLVGLIVNQWMPRPRMALLAGLLFLSLPVYSVSVFLISATDVLATLFYLIAVFSWIQYLRVGSPQWFIGTSASFVLGLLSKEFVVTLPVILFLMEILLFRRQSQIVQYVRRYSAFVLLASAYVLFELGILTQTTNFRVYGTSLGWHIFANAEQYVTNLIFPWNPVNFKFGLGEFGLALTYIVIVGGRYPALLGLTLVWAGLNILPVLGFQRMFSLRFLYTAGVALAVWWSVMIDSLVRILRRWKLASIVGSLLVSLMLVVNAHGVMAIASDAAENSRGQRGPFRDISRQHPSLPPDTFLYFIEPPVSVRDMSGMFYLRYGANVAVSEPLNNMQAHLRQHANPIIYYFDETGKPIEVPVSTTSSTRISPAVPMAFENGIVLHDYEISSDTLQPGKEMVLILYWGTTQAIQTNYTIFVHLVDRNGNMIEGMDGPPTMGKAPTRTWQIGQTITDTIIFSLPKDVSPQDNCRLEIGLYDFATGQRLMIVNDNGSMATNLEIAPIHIR